jgi:Bacterial SH3 domain
MGPMGPKRSLPRIAALGLWLLPAGGAWSQETMYVTDIVQLGVHRAADTSDTAFRNLVSGTEVTVLERATNFARIRTADGEEGWVRSFYLVDEQPARTRVAELEARVDTLERELATANAGREAAAAEAGNGAAEVALELEAEDAERARLAELELENQAWFERFESYRGMLPWPWVAGVVVLAFGAGGLAGYWWLDAAIRRRYGGFKLH